MDDTPPAPELATTSWLVPHDELDRRVRALQQRLRDRGVACALVAQAMSLFYCTGTIANGWLLLPADGQPRLLVRRAKRSALLETCWDVIDVRNTRELVAQLDDAGVRRGPVGLELDTLPAAEYLKLAAALPDVELIDVGHDVRSVRASKSDWELEHVRGAAQQVRVAMEGVAAEVRPGWREIDAFLLAERLLREHGHQGPLRMRRFNGEMFYGAVCAGANAAIPAALDAPVGGSGLYPSVGKGASERVLVRGDMLVLDIMGNRNGYLSDCTRMVAIGGSDAVDDDLLAAHRWCVGVLESVAEAARPGVATATLYDLAREAAEAAGVADRFMGAAPDQARFVGHGIGLEVDEYPFLAPGHHEPLQPGMVFALEPKLVFPGRAAVGIEDAFIVTNDGVEALEALPRAVL